MMISRATHINNQQSMAIRCLLPAVLALLVSACEKNPANGDGDDPTTMPQVHIPWPSLADSPWPMYRHDPQGTGRSQYVGPQLGEVTWSLPAAPGIQSSIGFTSFAIGPDSIIYFGSSYENVEGVGQTWVFYAVAPDGSVQWTFRDTTMHTHQYMERAPLVTADSTIIFAVPWGSEGYVYALHPDGNLRWRFHLDAQPSDLNIGLDGTLYLIGGNDLYALTPEGGLNWRIYANKEFRAYASAGLAISPDGATIYVCGDIGYPTLYAVGHNSQINWTFFSGDSTVITSSIPMVDNQGNIYIAPGRSYLGPADTSATGFFSLTSLGEVRWKIGSKGPSRDQYSIDSNGYIYYTVTSEPGRMLLRSLGHNGTERWAVDWPNVIAPLICDAIETIYVMSYDAAAISGANGEIIWQINLPGGGVWQCPALAADGILYIGIVGGEEYKYIYAIQ